MQNTASFCTLQLRAGQAVRRIQFLWMLKLCVVCSTFGDWIPAFEGVAKQKNACHSDAKSQNLGSIAPDKPSSFLRKQESRCWFDWIPACAGMTRLL